MRSCQGKGKEKKKKKIKNKTKEVKERKGRGRIHIAKLTHEERDKQKGVGGREKEGKIQNFQVAELSRFLLIIPVL